MDHNPREKNKEFLKVLNMDSLHSSDHMTSKCLQSLGIFPENTVLKKRIVIYWWIALFGMDTERYERIFSDLVNQKVLIAVHREHNRVIDSFTIETTFHKWLISISEKYGHVSSKKSDEGTWGMYIDMTKLVPSYMMLVNFDQRYLNSNDIMDISRKEDDLKVVQLGSWHNTEIKGHIEVNQIDFLQKLGENVAYLSLQGISRIDELDESIGKLEDLVILNLRACHNLEKLPHKPKPWCTLIQKLRRSKLRQDNVWFKNLKILDISECYLLDHMPKWICELSNLVVLKGFSVGRSRNKNQSCQLADLSKLNNLKKLNVLAGKILGPDVFQGFNSLDSILILSITWAQNGEISTYSLPKNLEKLDIRCYPDAEASKLQNPEELKNLKRLYIRGGNLTKIPFHDNWKVEILRLRFMKKLIPNDWNEVRSSFKNLKYAEYVECPRPDNFPNKSGNSWRNEE